MRNLFAKKVERNVGETAMHFQTPFSSRKPQKNSFHIIETKVDDVFKAVFFQKNVRDPTRTSLFLWISVLLLLAATIVLIPIFGVSQSKNTAN